MSEVCVQTLLIIIINKNVYKLNKLKYFIS